jgi:hypothetical protein
MAGDYIPFSDADFSLWVNNYVTTFQDITVQLGFLPADATALASKLTAFTTALGELATAQAAAKVAVTQKDQARAALESSVRSFTRRLQANPAVGPALKQQLGVTVPDTSPSPNLTPPASRPVAVVDTSERLRHTIKFADAATPTSRAKPKGIKGCEIWVKIGTPPSDITGGGDPKDLTFVALDTATPYLAEYASTDGGKTAYYLLRWISTRDEKGPWSETVEATIVG